jgi:hypothetical protein
MSAETLRRAAAQMRERAEAATPGPWHGFPPEAPPETQQVVWAGQATVAEVSMPIPPEFGLDGLADRDHIASWHPAVALAVADWLDLMAEEYAPYWSEPYAAPFVPVIEKAYQIARAYLGEQP